MIESDMLSEFQLILCSVFFWTFIFTLFYPTEEEVKVLLKPAKAPRPEAFEKNPDGFWYTKYLSLRLPSPLHAATRDENNGLCLCFLRAICQIPK